MPYDQDRGGGTGSASMGDGDRLNYNLSRIYTGDNPQGQSWYKPTSTNMEYGVPYTGDMYGDAYKAMMNTPGWQNPGLANNWASYMAGNGGRGWGWNPQQSNTGAPVTNPGMQNAGNYGYSGGGVQNTGFPPPPNHNYGYSGGGQTNYGGGGQVAGGGDFLGRPGFNRPGGTSSFGGSPGMADIFSGQNFGQGGGGGPTYDQMSRQWMASGFGPGQGGGGGFGPPSMGGRGYSGGGQTNYGGGGQVAGGGDFLGRGGRPPMSGPGLGAGGPAVGGEEEPLPVRRWMSGVGGEEFYNGPGLDIPRGEFSSGGGGQVAGGGNFLGRPGMGGGQVAGGGNFLGNPRMGGGGGGRGMDPRMAYLARMFGGGGPQARALQQMQQQYGGPPQAFGRRQMF